MRILETNKRIAKIKTWNLKNLVFESEMDIIDRLSKKQQDLLCNDDDRNHYKATCISNKSHMLVIAKECLDERKTINRYVERKV